MKKVYFLLFLLLVIIITPLSNKSFNQKNKNYNVYVEENGSYIKSSLNKLSSRGYILDSSESSCINNSTISQDSYGMVSVTTTKEEKCNFYFKKASDITLNKLHSLNSNIELKNISGYPKLETLSPKPTSYYDGLFSTNETYATAGSTDYYLTISNSYTFNETTGKYTLNNPESKKWSEILPLLSSGTYYSGMTGLSTSSDLQNYNNRDNLYKISTNSTTGRYYYYPNNIKKIKTWDENDVGVFSMEDDYGDSYYFRGNVENNYFKFGKNSSNQDMYWRIIRINGDGSIRLMYDGTSTHDNGEYNTDRIAFQSKFNDNTDDNGYIGYMYGNFTAPSTTYEEAHANEVSSSLKTNLESWYTTNIENMGYSIYVEDEIFCNDRSIVNGSGFGKNNTDYTGSSKIVGSYVNNLKCPQKNDSFTVNENIIGNAALSKPVGIITVSEMSIAGASGASYNYYAYFVKGTNYWTLSPRSYYNQNNSGYLVVVVPSGGLNYASGQRLNSNQGVAPVINIKRDYLNNIEGAGTKTNPFYIQNN